MLAKASNKEKLVDDWIGRLEDCGDKKSTPMERYWIARGIVLGQLIAKLKREEGKRD
jgi:hypothetical protein